ncbi:MAG: NUDIX hydrolase [Gammaproteobacteria bacterium]|nr:NUDIX hydrolase [Gammaproteobacteria bacterium]
MKFCAECGGPIVREIPANDTRLRFVCSVCRTIHYENPRVVAGCVPEWQGKILLCRRAIEPRLGRWTFPAGFMEMGETTVEAAVRETLEEANARVGEPELYTVMSLPHMDQVHMMYRAPLLDLDFSPGSESTEVELFDPDSVPWQELAFPTIHHTLAFYVEDLALGKFRVRTGDVIRDAAGFRFRIGKQYK